MTLPIPTTDVFHPLNIQHKPATASPELFQRLGLEKRGRRLINIVHDGLPVKILERLTDELQISQKALLKVAAIAPATLKRRRESGHLSRAESDRVYRIAAAFRSAIQLFEGDTGMAREWLQHPAKALGGCSPMAYLETEAGADEVQDLIGRLEHGVFA